MISKANVPKYVPIARENGPVTRFREHPDLFPGIDIHEVNVAAALSPPNAPRADGPGTGRLASLARSRRPADATAGAGAW